MALGLLAPLIGEWLEFKHAAVPARVTAVLVLLGGFALRWILVFAGQDSGWVSDLVAMRTTGDESKEYWNPYLAGVLLGLMLLATFLVAGKGLGASALPKRTLAFAAQRSRPGVDGGQPGARRLRGRRREPAPELAGGGGHRRHPRRLHRCHERRPFPGRWRRGRTSRSAAASTTRSGGGIMGFAAALARGCTSGQALSGGAMLATGSWVFMLMVFAGGYAVAYLVRRQWT